MKFQLERENIIRKKTTVTGEGNREIKSRKKCLGGGKLYKKSNSAANFENLRNFLDGK